MAPIINEPRTSTYAQPAVIATNPAKHPLIVIPKSGLPKKIHDTTVDVITPAMAAVFVVINI